MPENKTRKQHFLPRVDQKLNALNPQGKNRNLRIYSFYLVDRKNYILTLENLNGVSIDGNLFFLDLLSFDILEDNRLRHNFESLFQKYEEKTELQTAKLLSKLNAGNIDIKTEITDLFAAKLLNFIRNPFCIEKVLNTFPNLALYEPVDATLLDNYRRIVSGRKPHQANLCAYFGISDQQYVKWLRVLFILLVPMREGYLNFFEEATRGLLENRKTYLSVSVCEYDSDRCLLSDRGYSQPLPGSKHLAFSFNLCSTAFINYIFADLDTLIQGLAPPQFIAQAIDSWRNYPLVQFKVEHLRNDHIRLACYNRHVIEQCHGRVYCSTKDGLVLSDHTSDTRAS